MKNHYLLVAFIILVIGGCKKKDSSKIVNTGNILNENAYLVDTLAIINFSANSISLNKNASVFKPKIGDIILVPPTTSNPYGFLSKVTGVTESGNVIICNIIQSNLNEAFKQLSINTNYTDTFSASGSFRNGSSLAVSFNANNTLANGIGLSGVVKFNIPSTRIEFVKRSGTVIPDRVLIQADFNIEESSLEIKNTSNSAIDVVSERTLMTFNLPTITVPIPVGPIVIPIPFTQQLLIKILPISISGKAKWTIFPRVSATLGVKYENSTWTNLSTFSISATASPLFQGDFASTLSLVAAATIVKPVYEIKPLGQDALKGFFEIPNKLEFTLQPSAPNYSLKYKLDVTGGIKQNFWTGIDQEYSITGHLIERTILQGGNWAVLGPGEVISPTGRIWMDRNLGASRIATSLNDHLAYGNLYQWGRGADGHQLINWTSGSAGVPVNGITSILSNTNTPGHPLFIYSSSNADQDWRNPQNDNLWQGVNGINNPCPAGFRLPTRSEFYEESIKFPTRNIEGAFESVLKLPAAGRRVLSGILVAQGIDGFYWTSSIPTSIEPYNAEAMNFQHLTMPNQVNVGWIGVPRNYGFCVRCIKEQ